MLPVAPLVAALCHAVIVEQLLDGAGKFNAAADNALMQDGMVPGSAPPEGRFVEQGEFCAGGDRLANMCFKGILCLLGK
jgi:hypothetical protein